MLNRLTYLWNATFCGPFFKSYLGGGKLTLPFTT